MKPPERERLPDERESLTHKFTILATRDGKPDSVKGYLITGFYEDGRVGEIFVKLSKQGSRLSGFVDAWAISVSILRQVGVPLREITRRFRGMRFEPSGRVKEDNLLALSPIDYVCRYLEDRFGVEGVDPRRIPKKAPNTLIPASDGPAPDIPHPTRDAKK